MVNLDQSELRQGSKEQITQTAQNLGLFLTLLGFRQYANMLEVAADEVPDIGISPEDFATLADRVAARLDEAELTSRDREDLGVGGREVILALGDIACGQEFYTSAVHYLMRVENMWDELMDQPR